MHVAKSVNQSTAPLQLLGRHKKPGLPWPNEGGPNPKAGLGCSQVCGCCVDNADRVVPQANGNGLDGSASWAHCWHFGLLLQFTTQVALKNFPRGYGWANPAAFLWMDVFVEQARPMFIYKSS